MKVNKCLSIWQPWASAIAEGFKHNETRSWPTRYRGPIAIQAAQLKPDNGHIFDIIQIFTMFKKDLTWLDYLPLGQIVCIVELYDCIPTNDRLNVPLISDIEYHLGDYSTNRYIWKTRNLNKLKKPVPTTGRQRIFNISDNLITQENLA